MGYKGGGKTWVEPKGLGWVALERDWEGDLLPDEWAYEPRMVNNTEKKVCHPLHLKTEVFYP